MAEFHRYRDNLPTALSKAKFLTAFGGVYEHSPWIAEACFDRGLTPLQDSAEGLAAEMRDVVIDAGPAPQLALLRSHPDLAGRLALAGELTDDSTSEQASAALDQCSSAEYSEFQSLNSQYKAKVGFPFILAVRGFERGDILAIFRRRVENDPEAEFAEALNQVHRIALLRLQQIT